jgi:hypothetical protein
MPGKLTAKAVLSDELGEKSAGGRPSLLAMAKIAWRLRKLLN